MACASTRHRPGELTQVAATGTAKEGRRAGLRHSAFPLRARWGGSDGGLCWSVPSKIWKLRTSELPSAAVSRICDGDVRFAEQTGPLLALVIFVFASFPIATISTITTANFHFEVPMSLVWLQAPVDAPRDDPEELPTVRIAHIMELHSSLNSEKMYMLAGGIIIIDQGAGQRGSYHYQAPAQS